MLLHLDKLLNGDLHVYLGESRLVGEFSLLDKE